MEIQVKVNRWFQKSYGNTYHKVYVTSRFLESEISYGYGDAWTLTLCDLLARAGMIEERAPGMAPLTWLRDQGIVIKGESINDVQRKRDL